MDAEEPIRSVCGACGAAIAPSLVSCRACGQLVHSEELKRLAAEAERASAAGELAAALTAWRNALPLLPRSSRQHQVIAARIVELSREVDRRSPAASAAAPPPKWAQRAGPLGVAALVVWKLATLLIGPGKLLFAGLTKTSTLVTMLLSFGVYWTAYGWAYALGLVGSIYVHEMGHVAALRRFGIPATAPMFIPGVGAFVRLKHYPVTPVEDARVGLAGPIWGLGAALVAYAVFRFTGAPTWAAIAQSGGFFNLFNLLPLWQLDGARGFAAMTRGQRWMIALVIAAAWAITSNGLLILLLLVVAARALGANPVKTGDRTAFAQYAVLVAALAALAGIRVPG